MKNSLMLLALGAAAAALVPARADEKPEDKIPALVKDLSAKDEFVRLRATLELGKLGKPAVAPVAALLGDADADVRYYAVWALGTIGPDAKDRAGDVVKLLSDKNEPVRRKAVWSLGRIAAEPKDALPVLLGAMADDSEDVRAAAAEACAQFGKDAVPALTDALKSPKAHVRLQAAHALGEIGPDARESLPALAGLLKDKDDAVVTESAAALAKMGTSALPTLTDALKSDIAFVRAQAVEAVGKVEGPEAVNALVDALKAPRPDVRRAAARVLGGLGIGDKLVVLSLAEVLKKDDDDQARLQAVTALRQLRTNATPAVPALKVALADDNPQVRITAFSFLTQLRQNPAESAQEHLKGEDKRARINAAAVLLVGTRGDREGALQTLNEGLKETDAALRYQAAFGLVAARQKSGEALSDVLLEALKDKKASVRERAAAALTPPDRGPDAKAQAGVNAALTEALKDESPDVRRLAAGALARLGGDAKVVLPVLAELLKDADASVRLETLARLANYRRDAVNFGEDVVPYLADGLEDKDPQVRANAATYLRAAGPAAAKALSALVKVVRNDRNLNVRRSALRAVQGLGEEGLPGLVELVTVSDAAVQLTVMRSLQQYKEKAKAAVPNLIKVLEGGDDDARRLAAQTLGTIGPDARDAIDPLKEAARSPNATVKQAAEQALQLIEKK
jgi:HEAT repeat protein